MRDKFDDIWNFICIWFACLFVAGLIWGTDSLFNVLVQSFGIAIAVRVVYNMGFEEGKKS